MSGLKLAAAQVASQRGDIARNIDTHLAAISVAAECAVSVLLFPELSLIGYEPDIAREFVIKANDPRLEPLADAARRNHMQIVVGAPIHNELEKPFLGAVIFREDGSIETYAKMHLGSCETKFFTPGNVSRMLSSPGHLIGLSICADSSQPSHPAAYAAAEATVYAGMVFLNEEWYRSDSPRFQRYAAEHQMLVLMANHGSSRGTLSSVGNSAIWSPDGTCLACAHGTESALVVAERVDSAWRGEVKKLVDVG
jgi:predicted amidohydrolase